MFPPNISPRSLKRMLSAGIFFALLLSVTAHALQENEKALLEGEGPWRDILDFVESNEFDVTYALIASSDSSCKFCAKATEDFETFEQRNEGEFGFISIDINPWAEKDLRTHLYFDLIENKPVVLLFYKKNLIRKIVNPGTGQLAASKKFIPLLEPLGGLQRYGQLLEERLDKIVASDGFAKYEMKYLKATGHKAFAMHDYGTRYWVGNYVSNRPSQAIADEDALGLCNAQLAKKKREEACRLYWSGDDFVYHSLEKD